MRERRLRHLRAEALTELGRALEDLTDAGLDALGLDPELAGDADPEPFQVLESRASLPTIADSSSAASRTSRVNGPHWSREEAKAIMPEREIAP